MRLALVAIVKDEESCIQRMLKSAATITDEQIVVDTGSSDATPELAAAAGARVFRYKWNDSFRMRGVWRSLLIGARNA